MSILLRINVNNYYVIVRAVLLLNIIDFCVLCISVEYGLVEVRPRINHVPALSIEIRTGPSSILPCIHPGRN